MNLAEAAAAWHIPARNLQRAARDGVLRTEATVHGYVTTADWMAEYVATRRRPGRPRKER